MSHPLAGVIITKLRYLFSPYHDDTGTEVGPSKILGPWWSDFKPSVVKRLAEVVGVASEDRIGGPTDDLDRIKGIGTVQWRDTTEEDRRAIAQLVGKVLKIDPEYFQDGFDSKEGNYPIKRDAPKVQEPIDQPSARESAPPREDSLQASTRTNSEPSSTVFQRVLEVFR
jgi:hypothetical protein